VSEAQRRARRESPRILDVGSGRGEILVAARDAGFDAVGLELSAPFIEDARRQYGVEARLATVEELAQSEPAASFDVVFANAVIEHVYDPDSFMRSVALVLRPGGVLCADLPREPNILTATATALARLRGRRINYYLAPTWEPFHLYGFNPAAIRALLRKHGLEIEELHVRSRPMIPSDGTLGDRVRALGGSLLVRAGNRIGYSTNMDLWARLSG
jgi:2-polyprenyl-6-hydroxyphenyl methylase/3-demethylubiquinone-9 3-methyltransferase